MLPPMVSIAKPQHCAVADAAPAGRLRLLRARRRGEFGAALRSMRARSRSRSRTPRRTRPSSARQIAKDPIVKKELERYAKVVKEAKTIDEVLDDPVARRVFLKANGLGDQADAVALAKKALTSDLDDERRAGLPAGERQQQLAVDGAEVQLPHFRPDPAQAQHLDRGSRRQLRRRSGSTCWTSSCRGWARRILFKKIAAGSRYADQDPGLGARPRSGDDCPGAAQADRAAVAGGAGEGHHPAARRRRSSRSRNSSTSWCSAISSSSMAGSAG